MASLADRNCEPCKGGVPPLTAEQWQPLLAELDADWAVVDAHHLAREYRLEDFAAALAFVNRVGALAEEVFHHPDLTLAWGRVRVEIWTHKIKGLHEADFIFAAKCDRLFGS
jgi:4a-hydroxytetrahydrobiopterin dehydratase